MNQIIRRTIKHCTKLLLGSRCSSLPFHNVTHTLEVFENVSKIGEYENIAFEDLEPILLAALFHDTGNAKVFKGHEDFSIAEAITFLMSQKYPIDKIILAVDCIKATRIPQHPNNKYEEIICDADLFHLGTRSYILKNILLRKE